jgi:hypothetical protein
LSASPPPHGDGATSLPNEIDGLFSGCIAVGIICGINASLETRGRAMANAIVCYPQNGR